jgi:hypothetical protein
MANPNVRPHLHFFPEDCGVRVNETRQADRWLHEWDEDQLTPMARIGSQGNFQDYYIYEPALLKDRTAVMPIRWFMRSGKLFASAYKMDTIPHASSNLRPCCLQRCWVVCEDQKLEVAADDFLLSFPEFSAVTSQYGMPDLELLTRIFSFIHPNASYHHTQ